MKQKKMCLHQKSRKQKHGVRLEKILYLGKITNLIERGLKLLQLNGTVTEKIYNL